MNILVKGNKLSFNGKTYQCAIGKNGFAVDKKEGDNCTPVGEYPIREILYRADKIAEPKSKLPISRIAKNEGWCDAPNDVNYNRKVKLPYNASHEKLWREDNLYDVVVPLGYNDAPVVPGKGSAIFMHVAKIDYQGTEGCVALKLPDLLDILSKLDRDSKIIIRE